jgi:lantibiotic modifying enzyme
MVLFDPARHEPLIDDPWDPAVVRAAIRDVVGETLAAARDGRWPAHPLDGEEVDGGSTLYAGAAGVLWGLAYLASEAAVEDDARIAEWTLTLPQRYLAAPDTGSVVPSYFLGESGVLLTALRARSRPEWYDRLAAVTESNIENPTLEALWGAPGTMLAAVFLHERTGEARWGELFRRNVSALLRTWPQADERGPALWVQDLYGERRTYLGPAHGFAGNVFAMLRGGSLLQERERTAIVERAVETLRATASIDGACANWPPFPGSEKLLVQWCHGAPGMTTALGRCPVQPELDRLLAMAGELTWRAGPLRKGPGLCHGTAGNGAAFLTLFARNGDSLWLDRARRFAMHAIRQTIDARVRYGRNRFSLWTGDVGVAVYLWQCVRGTSGLPTLDF